MGDENQTGRGSTTLRRYVVRNDKGRWVGTFIICDDGYFSTVSDYGSYAYYWSQAGECFRSFLCRIDSCYLLGKLSRRDWYDSAETLKDIKRHIVEARRSMNWTREKARKEWDLLAEHDDLFARENFSRWYEDTSIYDASEFYVSGFPPDARGFAREAWPHFVAALRAELDAERAALAVEVAP